MKYAFKQLLNRSYQAIVNRGLITPKTKPYEFIDKINEEVAEVEECLSLEVSPDEYIDYEIENKDRYVEELTDLATVCIMQIHHLGYDFEKEFEKVVLKNERRANEQQ